MSIRKHPISGVYFVDIAAPSGERIRRSTGTKDRREAQEYHDKLKANLWRAVKLGEKPPRMFEEAAMKFLKQESETNDYESKERHLAWFGKCFVGRALHTLTSDEIMEALPQHDQRRHAKLVDGKPRLLSNATRNRYLATIRAMLNDASEVWQWIDKAPKLIDLPERTNRVRWITKEEAQRLLTAIQTDWMRDATHFGFATGLRQANILELEWSQVDLVTKRAWIHPDQAKAKKPIGVPLNAEAVAIVRRQIGKHQTHVFTRCGKVLKYWDAAQWKAACKRAGITNFRFHDVRHTWASWHVQAGTPLNRLMEMGGWATYEMVLRYAHLAPDHLAEHANVVQISAQPVTEFHGTENKKAG